MARTLTRRRSAEPTPAKKYKGVDDVATAPEEEGSEDSAPRGRRTLRTDKPKATRPAVKKGWDAADDAKSGDFPDDLEVTGDAILIHFLDNEPFAVYKQHWIERKGKKSWICLEDDCPLCDDIGDRPSAKICFNVVDLSDPEKPVNKLWTAGTQVATTLKNLNKDKKVGPLDRDDLYFSVSKSKSGKSSSFVYVVSPVKARDVSEDWDIDPLSEEELVDFDAKAYDDTIVEYHTHKQLSEISAELLD
jgi:hypothetical protein